MVRRLNKRRSNKQKSKKATMVVYQCEKTSDYFADYDQFGPVERDPWPTPVNSEASSMYSDWTDSEDEDEEDEEDETVRLKVENEEIDEIASIEAIDAIDNVTNDIFKLNYLTPNINGTVTNVSRYLFPSLPSQGSLYFG